MACGATLKRSVGLKPIHGPPSPKRQRCSPRSGSGAASSGQKCSLSAAVKLHSSAEQIFQNFRQEYGQYQRLCQAEEGVQSDSQESGDERTHSPVVSPTRHPATDSAPSSPKGVCMKRDQPSFTLWQVRYLCECVIREHEEALKEEYDRVLNIKLAEQYEAFVKFTEDQIVRRYGTRPASYVS
ncbi:akirin-1B-like [Salminus brasiliensis]|uniref:akirin-1B-like n=1 Tax=Salminus brasiliensis TaxID=930266 RepID=UPI003B836D75